MKTLGIIAAAALAGGSLKAAPETQDTRTSQQTTNIGTDLATYSMPKLTREEINTANLERLEAMKRILDLLKIPHPQRDNINQDPDTILASLFPLEGKISSITPGQSSGLFQKLFGGEDSGLRKVTTGASDQDRELSLKQNTKVLVGDWASSIPSIFHHIHASICIGGTLENLAMVQLNRVKEEYQARFLNQDFSPHLSCTEAQFTKIVINNEAAHALLASITIEDRDGSIRKNPFFLPNDPDPKMSIMIKKALQGAGITAFAQASTTQMNEAFSDAAAINTHLAGIHNVLQHALYSPDNFNVGYNASISFCRSLAIEFLIKTADQRSAIEQTEVLNSLQKKYPPNSDQGRDAYQKLTTALGKEGFEWIQDGYCKFGQTLTRTIANYHLAQKNQQP